MQPGVPQGPQNIRTRMTGGKFELRKYWNIREAKFVYVLFSEYEQQTCAMKEEDGVEVPNWDEIVESKMEMAPADPQGGVGDEEWAQRNAEHYGIELPTEEYKDGAEI